MFFNVLAVMHAPAYTAENAGALRQDWPRVPMGLPGDPSPLPLSPGGERGSEDPTREWLLRGAALGRRVAALLDIETPVPGVDAGELPEGLRRVARYEMADGSMPRERTEDVALRARWGYRGQGGVTMPGPDASVAELPEGDGEAALHLLPPPLAGARGGGGTRHVPANARAGWTGVPDAVWNYHLGGYQVLKKWLSYREEAILGRPLTLDEVRTFSAICRRIASLLSLGPELDAHYRAAAG